MADIPKFNKHGSGPSLDEAFKLLADNEQFKRLSNSEFQGLLQTTLSTQAQDRKENQIYYYQPVSATAEKVHCSRSKFLGIGGGNGGSKTDTMLAELVMLATGIIPEHLKPEVREALRAKFRGPCSVRIVVESLTTTLAPIILPKLQWWMWSGIDMPGGKRGHWGWIPKRALISGNWVRSWSEKLRMLRVLCFDPDNPGKVLGESRFQFMSYDQSPEDFASGDFHFILHDEPPNHAIWNENEARTMRVGGRMLMAMTWPDDPSIAVDWIYDDIYEPGLAGTDPEVDWLEMYTTDNPNLDQDAIKIQADHWSSTMREVRLRGQPIRFSNRVHPLFTKDEKHWCPECKVPRSLADGRCHECGGELVTYCHVRDFPAEPSLPTVYLIDPHPRKPHFMLWAQIDTWDDIFVVAEALVEGGCDEVAETVREVEQQLKLHVVQRLGDPNMLRSPSGAKRNVTWQDEFAAAKVYLELADNSDVGRSRINNYLAVDADNWRPRLHVHPRCDNVIRQMLRYVWDDYKKSTAEGRDQKQTPKAKDDDMPALLKYLLNSEPSFKLLSFGAPILHTDWRKKT